MPRKENYSETDISGSNLYFLCESCNGKFFSKDYLIRHLIGCGSNLTGACEGSFKEPDVKKFNKNSLCPQLENILHPGFSNLQPSNSNTIDDTFTGDQISSARHKQSIVQAEKLNASPDIPPSKAKDSVEKREYIDKQSVNFTQKPGNFDIQRDAGTRGCQNGIAYHEKDVGSPGNASLNLKAQSCDSESENNGKVSKNTVKPGGRWRHKKVTCKKCELLFKNKSVLYKHMSQEHGDRRERLVQFGKECVCKMAYNSSAQLRYHIRKHHFNLQAVVPYCEQKKVNQVWFEKVMNCNNIMEIKKTAPNTLVMRRLNENTAMKVNDVKKTVIDLTELYPTRRNNKCE